MNRRGAGAAGYLATPASGQEPQPARPPRVGLSAAAGTKKLDLLRLIPGRA
jgi:hypothetical protein